MLKDFILHKFVKTVSEILHPIMAEPAVGGMVAKRKSPTSQPGTTALYIFYYI